MSFSQPVWSRVRSHEPAPHVVSVLVTPSVTIVSSSIAAATVIATLAPHHFVTGDTVAIAGHVGSTPAVDGARVVTVVDALHFSVPLAVTVAGAGGTVTRTLAVDPLTLAEGKLRAGFEGAWTDGDPRDALMLGFIASARHQVELDTGIALLSQTYDVFCDALPQGPIALPWRPIQSVTSVKSTDSAGVVTILDPSNYLIDPSSVAATPARMALTDAGVWPTDVRTFQPWAIRIVVGFPTVALLRASAPDLIEAVGLLVAHAATAGRDRFTESALRDEYDEKIAPYTLVSVA